MKTSQKKKEIVSRCIIYLFIHSFTYLFTYLCASTHTHMHTHMPMYVSPHVEIRGQIPGWFSFTMCDSGRQVRVTYLYPLSRPNLKHCLNYLSHWVLQLQKLFSLLELFLLYFSTTGKLKIGIHMSNERGTTKGTKHAYQESHPVRRPHRLHTLVRAKVNSNYLISVVLATCQGQRTKVTEG